MSNRIVGLKYIPPVKVKTEEELLQTFADLRENYTKLSQNFSMTYLDGKKVENFKQFLRIATMDTVTGHLSPTVVLNGSGDIGGLVVKDASLEYNLSLVSAAVQYWDIYRDGYCNSCRNRVDIMRAYGDDGRDFRCGVGESTNTGECPQYKAYRQNAQGKTARTLKELFAEATKDLPDKLAE